ncbi:hypothetical protein ACFV4F_35370 [Kitasatospora sp. NPDC059722]|uniref:hypothetical protein n=1 Tax=unclassified Kitasatospora TaxID=2633591 RepID=UPI0036678730
MTIELHIDHLVLDGLDGLDDLDGLDGPDGSRGATEAIAAALRTELARLLSSAPAATWRPARAGVLHGPEVTVGGAESTGRELAGSVFRAVRDGR